MQFVLNFTDELIGSYISHVGKLDQEGIKERIIQKNFQNQNNLRTIKRNIMNIFVELVGANSAWLEEKTRYESTI